MPELPEVEWVRRGLQRSMSKETVISVWRSPQRLRTGAHWNQSDENLHELVGARPGRITRRGKYLIWDFDYVRRASRALLIHLGMTGRCDVVDALQPYLPHTHLRITSCDGREFRFADPRRFGGLRVATRAELLRAPPLATLGPEPLAPGFGGQVLQAAAGQSRRVLRDVLLDQRVVAGVGNIYAVEALYRAGLHPLLPADRLRTSAWQRLSESVRAVLVASIESGGTTLRDFRHVGGELGSNQEALRVYGRAGQPCGACGVTLRRFTTGGRSGVFCPAEQRRPRCRRVA
ncbi:MAG: bifunctional DNA-formamidopyrimidine glycosylase/DNA-(apurinic or apyrimidinic site) lyase [Nannocystaceae bacterium]